MYTRDMSEMPPSFVKNKKPVFGTFLGHPKRLDIRGVYKPYSTLALPSFITNLRIKSRITLYFNIEQYVGYINFIDAKMFGWAEVTFWSTETGKKFVYHNVMGPRKRFIPHSLERASTSSYRKSRYIRISWDRMQKKLSVIFNLRGNSVRPDVHASIAAKFGEENFGELTYVLPSPTMRRCSATYVAGMTAKGIINLVPKRTPPIPMTEKEGSCIFEMNRIYTSFRNHGEHITGFGNFKEQNLTFRLEDKQLENVDPDRINGNQMMLDGKITLLPPVRITHSQGIQEKWVIQDTEGMVDLTFMPISDNLNTISVLILRTVYHIIYGKFEGTLVDSEGQKISFKSFPGIADKYLVRL